MWLLELVDDSDEVQFLSFVRDGVLYCIGLLLVMYVLLERFGRKK
jgi:hypothetical protein